MKTDQTVAVDAQLRSGLAAGAYRPALTLLAEKTYLEAIFRYCLRIAIRATNGRSSSTGECRKTADTTGGQATACIARPAVCTPSPPWPQRRVSVPS